MPLKPPKSRNPKSKSQSKPKPNTSPKRVPSSLPPNWPPQLAYYTTPQLSPTLSRPHPPSASLNLHTRTAPTPPSPLVRIKPIATASHPACGQHGLFATHHLPARSWVIDYIGYYHTVDESDATSDYDIALDREAGVAVDASRGGNEARFVNDFRGVAERPNVEFGNRRVDGQERIAVWVGSREVRKGEELLVSYGKGFWEGRKGE